MANDNKAVGPLAAARLVTLIKAETAKKYDKTGGKINGSAEITGGLKVGMSSEFSSSIKAGSEISSDMFLMAPIVALYDPATEESISFGVSGENAAKVTSPVSGGGTQYARLAVGTPTGDNDAATKAYVDSKAKKDFVVNITFDSTSAPAAIDDSNIAVFNAITDKTFAEISSAVAAGENVYGMWNGHKWPLYLSSPMVHAFRGSVQLDKVFGSVGLAIANCAIDQNGCTVTASAGELPAPALDGTDDGKGIVVSGGKWTMKKDVVDTAMSDTSTNPVQNKVIKKYIDEKGVNYFDTYVEKPTKEKLTAYADYYTCECKATHTYAEIAAALAKDMVPRVLLVDVIGSVGANRIVCPLNEYYSGADGSYDFDAPNIAGMYGYGTGIVSISEDGAVYTCSAGELPPATDKDNGKCLVVDGGRYRCGTPAAATQSTPGYMSAADKAKLDGIEAGANKTVVDATLDAASTNPVQNKAVKTALDGKAGTAVATTSANGLVSAADKAKLDGVEAGANKTTVDAALDAASENPVQNKAVKAALDGKLSTLGGEISGHLDVGQTVSAEGSVSVGRTSSDTGIHFEKAASDAGRISHGSDPMTGVSPIARLKVADPTEDDDAATKAYVDGRAVRYDAAQTLTDAQKAQARENVDAASAFAPILTSPVMIRKWGETESAGVYLSTVDIGEKHAEIRLEDVNENSPVAIANLRTPTDAQTDYAANVAYVKAKVAEVAASGGVDVDNALSATSTNPVQNKVITSALAKKAGTAVATESANGLMSKADKTKLDGIAAGATKITIDSAMSGSSNNPVANHVVKQYVDDKVTAAGSNITVDSTLSSTSTNPVQNKAVKAAIDGKLSTSGGTLTGNLTGKYITGTWLQSTAAANLGKTPGKIAVLDDSGWVYYRTPAELFADLGIANAIKSYVDTAIAVAINSAY